MNKTKSAKTTISKSKTPTVQHYSSKIEWVDGMPTVVAEKSTGIQKFGINANDHLKALFEASLALPYEGEDPRYQGMTKGEAIALEMVDAAANGDEKARSDVLDRVMGKPQQNVKSLTVKASLADYLDSLSATPTPTAPITAEDI